MNGEKSKRHHNRSPAESPGRLIGVLYSGIGFYHISDWASGYDPSPRILVNHTFVRKLHIYESYEEDYRIPLICAGRECPYPLPD